jgi:hypothetical protein
MWTLSSVKVMPDRLGGEGAENVQKLGNFTMYAQPQKQKARAISEIIEARALALFLHFRVILISEHVSFLRPWHL